MEVLLPKSVFKLITRKMKQLAYAIKVYFMKVSVILTFLGILISANSFAKVPGNELNEQFQMKKAVPVWVQGRETEMNLMVGFRGVFQSNENQSYILKITASTLYRVYLNGEYVGYGPARAAHGYFRVDEYELGKYVKKDKNILAIEVAGYNVNSYYTLDQTSFLQAEVELEGKTVLASGNGSDFEAFQLKERLQKVERYSYQRTFTEYYRLEKDFDQWKKSMKVQVEPLKLSTFPTVKLLPRNLLLPGFDIVRPVSVCANGTVQFRKPEKYKKDRSLTQITDKYKGFPEADLEVIPSLTVQEIISSMEDTVAKPFKTVNNISLSENQFCTFNFGINLSGFIGGKINCTEPSRVVFYFDEILLDGDVNSKKRQSDINNWVVYELAPGNYNLETFESYTFKFLKIIVLKGSCTIQDVYLREYAYPENKLALFNCSNNQLNEIYKAARQTFRQNAVDLLTDCPSRERAGWLCDSYFSAIVEKDFTGRSAVTRNFYENYALPEKFPALPDGMVPMCYPADHINGNFIPNWALWFVLQVNDFARRGGDPILVANLKPKIEGILNYFSKFENENGLLEKLDKWIFVEWSEANNFVQDVNYPTNMLYSAALSNAANLYRNEDWKRKSERIRKSILKQSYNGTFFIDNAIRNKDGKLENTSNTTEICQYYAFYFNLVTPESHPELWKRLITEFGPNRNVETTYPKVFKANALNGNYIRLEILSRYGMNKQVLKEVQDYFYKMAQLTGTLWEMMDSGASCNHGFASYLGHILYRDALGIRHIDYIGKVVTICFSDIDIDECSGVIPVEESTVELKWKRINNQIKYTVKLPTDYKIKIENKSSAELVRVE
jgi:alpha-L-rhamnosidase